ncbi:conserved putative membrane protein [Candidatus Protochlamydia naegleriophila]|uniref:Conserved putative membrane protein n=1 Tax=Candidatus Protochlamydia naegleriophila TaxID=389348 RepID=A0A0U5ETL8_9BACT|nr:alpha/beta hydrolase [Candidatus Protochlamydia naegleriophila]CUI17537.1 conserved putative membrane protein [Candidatus Protochlamydia naegleriophila]
MRVLFAFFIVLSCYIMLLLGLFLKQRELLYFPSQLLPSPAEAGVAEMRVVSLKTSDGLTLKAWYRRAQTAGYPTILYLHGNAGHIGNRGRSVKPFLNEGYGVLLVTYRGYSQNPGEPYEEGFYRDGRAALKFLNDLGIDDQHIILYGESIGTAVAIQLASEYQVAALILQSPFSSLADVAQFHYPYLPVRWLLKDRFDSIQKITRIQAPTLAIYAENDEIIPPSLSKQLIGMLKTNKQILSIPNVAHNDLESDLAVPFIRQYVNSQRPLR